MKIEDEGIKITHCPTNFLIAIDRLMQRYFGIELGCTGLTSIAISRNHNITDAGVAFLSQQCI